MSELEMHTHHHPLDPFGHRVAIFVGIIGIVLVQVTILAHREHTAAVVHKTEANDEWNLYEAKKIKKDNEEIAATLLTSLASDPAKVAAQIDKIHADAARYEKDSDTVKDEAQKREAESLHSEARALRFDLAEGFLELGLVMSSLYFLAQRRFFVGLGGAAALIGAVLGVVGLLT